MKSGTQAKCLNILGAETGTERVSQMGRLLHE